MASDDEEEDPASASGPTARFAVGLHRQEVTILMPSPASPDDDAATRVASARMLVSDDVRREALRVVAPPPPRVPDDLRRPVPPGPPPPPEALHAAPRQIATPAPRPPPPGPPPPPAEEAAPRVTNAAPEGMPVVVVRVLAACAILTTSGVLTLVYLKLVDVW